MYKIYINETPLFLTDNKELTDFPPADETHLVARYPGTAKLLLAYADMLEKSRRYDTVVLYSEDYNKLVRDFESHYQLIEAAGGVVFNPEGQMLVIFRRDNWDLPKGKIDPGESKEAAAVREVQEETGLQQVKRGPLLCSSYHTYRTGKGKRVLKRTYWYRMETSDTTLIPQTEEDIEQAVWEKPETFLNDGRIMYNTIREVVQKAIDLPA